MRRAVEESAPDPPAGRPEARASLAADNLRAVVILLVVAFHSVLAYLSFLPHHPAAFNVPPYLWRAFPVIDRQRWAGFDLFCAWLDVFLMSFFFLLSGLFAWPSLKRRGAGAFLWRRALRLGLPFFVGVTVLMPLAHYPVYLQSTARPTVADYWRQLQLLPGWPAGPMWFLWLLLAGDVAAAGLYRALGGKHQTIVRLSAAARRRPGRFLAGLVLASALAYVPLALVFGTMAWWQGGPFSFQLARPLHYAVYFLAGVAIGAGGIERSLAAPDGPLARQWRFWLAAVPPAFALWAGLTGWRIADGAAAPLALRAADGLSFALACLASCIMVLTTALRFAATRRPAAFDSLKNNAYGIYLVHYVFVVWLQYALLAWDAPAIAKAALVFAGTLSASWGLTAAFRCLPGMAQVIGGDRRGAGAGSARGHPVAAGPLPTMAPRRSGN